VLELIKLFIKSDSPQKRQILWSGPKCLIDKQNTAELIVAARVKMRETSNLTRKMCEWELPATGWTARC